MNVLPPSVSGGVMLLLNFLLLQVPERSVGLIPCSASSASLPLSAAAALTFNWMRVRHPSAFDLPGGGGACLHFFSLPPAKWIDHSRAEQGGRHQEEEEQEEERVEKEVEELMTVSCLAAPTGRGSPESTTSSSISEREGGCVCERERGDRELGGF